MRPTKEIFTLFTALLLPMSLHAAFSLVHTDGPSGLMANGMQAVHTDTYILYANSGEMVRLIRPDRCAFTGYVRWYCYDTDRAAERITNARSETYTLTNDYGWFKNSLNTRASGTKNYYEVDYTMHSGDEVYRVALDQSIYKDYSPSSWSSSITLTEPTLSKRTIYEMHPAKEMAARMDTCTGDKYLEVHKMMAPVGRQLYIGPDYRFTNGQSVGNNSFTYTSRSNYCYNASAPVHMNVNSQWQWAEDGNTPTVPTAVSAQYIGVSGTTAGMHTYTL